MAYKIKHITVKEIVMYVLTILAIVVLFINPIIFWAAMAKAGTAASLLWEAIVVFGSALVTLGSGLF